MSLSAEYCDCISFAGTFNYADHHKWTRGTETEFWRVVRLRLDSDGIWRLAQYLSDGYDSSSAARRMAKSKAEELKVPFIPSAYAGSKFEDGKAS